MMNSYPPGILKNVDKIDSGLSAESETHKGRLGFQPGAQGRPGARPRPSSREIAGVPFVLDLPGIVERIMTALPDTRKIVVIIGANRRAGTLPKSACRRAASPAEHRSEIRGRQRGRRKDA
jgi:hypothetical protein